MIDKRRFRVFIAISFAAGLLFVLNLQLALAQSTVRDGRNTLVDGGLSYEDFSQSEVIEEDLEFDIAQFRLPRRAVTQTSGDSLQPIRIIPLGDSITKGTGTCSEPDTYLNCIGYREDLWNALVDNGYSIDFVGSQGEAFQYQYSYDNDHEGHGGKTADWIRDRVYGPFDHFLLDNPADIVLLHIGTMILMAYPF